MEKNRERLLSFVIGIVICMVALEIALRVVGSMYARMSETDNTPERTGAKTILCIGDSVTFGIGAPRNLSYPAQLQKLLNDLKSKTTYTVINRGRPGQNSAQLLTRFEGQLKQFQPDLVTVLIGAQNQSNFFGYRDFLKNSENSGREWLLSIHDMLDRIKIYKFTRLLIKDLSQGRRRSEQMIKESGNTDQAAGRQPETVKTEPKLYPQTTGQQDATAAAPPFLGPPNADGSPQEEKQEPGLYPNKAGLKYTPECVTATRYKIQGDDDRALELIEAVTGKKTVESECYGMAGMIYLERKLYDKAVSWYEKGIDVDPAQFRNYEGIGMTFLERNRLQEALVWFKKGFEHARYDSLYELSYSAIAETFQRLGDYRGAVEFFQKETQRQPLVDDYMHSLAGDYLSIFQTKKRGAKVHGWIRSDVEKIIELCRQYKARVVLQNYPAEPMIEHIYRKVARRHDLPFVDHHSTFKKFIGKGGVRDPDYFVPDGHPNAKGYGIMAKNLLNVLNDSYLQ